MILFVYQGKTIEGDAVAIILTKFRGYIIKMLIFTNHLTQWLTERYDMEPNNCVSSIPTEHLQDFLIRTTFICILTRIWVTIYINRSEIGSRLFGSKIKKENT
jgi:hypothetical protein